MPIPPSPGKRYAEVIGDPISHSKSPVIHNFWLSELGIDAQYRMCHVKADELGAYFEARGSDSDFVGCNITIPHKIAALDHVSDPGEVGQSIGAINTVARSEGTLFGTNSDAGGFAAPISDMDLAGKRAVLIGAGGAARAICYGLKQMGIGDLVIMARSPLKAMALLSHFGLKGEVIAMDASLPPAALLVNSSPLGMTGQDPLDIDLSPLPAEAVVYDIVYAPLETALLKQARQRDLEVVDGLEMLIGQAAIAFELFFGQPPPDNDRALRRKLTAS